MSTGETWSARAANGHTMIYDVRGWDDDGRPDLIQHSAVHNNENCPCVRYADDDAAEPMPDW